MTVLIVLVVIGALYFDFCNGWNDSANAIATVVSTRVLTPIAAIILAALLNFVGALAGQKVAKVIAFKIINRDSYQIGAVEGQIVVLAAVIAAAAWITIVTRKGLPVSGSHSLIGGLLGAGLAMGGIDAINGGGVQKVLLALLFSPLLGLALGFLLMAGIMWVCARLTAMTVNRWFGKLQILSVSWMAFEHGRNDAQKAMGIITLALFASGYFNEVAVPGTGTPGTEVPGSEVPGTEVPGTEVPGPEVPSTEVPGTEVPTDPKTKETKLPDIPFWVTILCAAAMAIGTAAGGWRVMKTVGQGLTKLKPVQGFAAETAASVVLAIAATLGLPVSTTHTITATIMGVGATGRASAVRWGIGKKIAAAWIYTFPATMIFGALVYWLGLEIFKPS